jgi:hypothetical protein
LKKLQIFNSYFEFKLIECFVHRSDSGRVARETEEHFGQPELQRPTPQQVQWLCLRCSLALRPRPRPPHQAEQVLHSRHSQVSPVSLSLGIYFFFQKVDGPILFV